MLLFFFRQFDEDIDAYSLHDIEDILIFAAIRSGFFLAGIAVQVEDINLVEDTHQFATHLPMDKSVNKTIVADICHYAFAITLHIMLRQTDKLDIVVRKGLYIALVEVLFVVVKQFVNPFAFVVATNRIRRIAHNNHHRSRLLDMGGFVGFLCQVVAEKRTGFFTGFLEGVGQEDFEALLGRNTYLHVEFEMGNRIWCHHQFEAMQTRQ